MTTTRIGLITPSSNTILEPITYRILHDRPDITAHFSRLRVINISLDESEASQFTVDNMVAAAQSLADAEVNVIAWDGTSGSWLGLDLDREICEAITKATGVPATTSALAILDAYKAFGICRVGIVTPYVASVTAEIAKKYAQHGLQVVADEHAGLTKNTDFSRVDPDEVQSLIERAASGDAEGIGIICTNFDGAPFAAKLEPEIGMPIIDSVTATLWKAVDLAGMSVKVEGWGALMSSGQLRSALQPVAEQLLQETAADRTTFRLDSPGHHLGVGLAAVEAVRSEAMRSLRHDASLNQRGMNTVMWMEKERRNLIQPNFDEEPKPASGLIDVYGVQAQMLGPIVRGGDMVGWLSAHSIERRDWSDRDVAALEHAVAQVHDVMDRLSDQF